MDLLLSYAYSTHPEIPYLGPFRYLCYRLSCGFGSVYFGFQVVIIVIITHEVAVGVTFIIAFLSPFQFFLIAQEGRRRPVLHDLNRLCYFLRFGLVHLYSHEF